MRLTIQAEKTEQKKGKQFFFDTEFDEDGVKITLISIGIVSEDGEEYYAVSKEFNEESCNDWVKENVLPHLPKDKSTRKWKVDIRKEIVEFCGKNPIFWANHASYDWVVLCQMFGPMVDLPEGYPTWVRDIRQEEERLKAEYPFKQEGTKHNALEDAKHNLKMYKYLKELDANL
jgi:hypothetical protein